MRWASTIVAVASLVGAVVASAPRDGDVADRVLEFIQQQRREAAVAPLERRDDLDRVAAARIRTLRVRPVAGDPRPGLEREDALLPLLEAEGVGPYEAVYEYLDVRRAHTRGEAMARLWRSQPEAWDRAIGPEADSIGLATARTADHWIVLVAVLLDEAERRDPGEMARDALARINALRSGLDLPSLAPRGGAADTRRRASLRARYRGPGDAVGAAIAIWSRDPLRADLLDPAFRQAAVEVSESEGGEILFELVLLEPGE